ncbi:MAG: hypothetical protein KIS62_04980 [Ramlibacter sp.]|nr:hypothetical protein [Ramlibacter sp.]
MKPDSTPRPLPPHLGWAAAALATLAVAGAPAWAQTATPPPKAQPPRSALQDYRPYVDEKPSDWREANDLTARIGGWRGYAREAQAPDTEAPSESATPDPHAAHGGHAMPRKETP